MHVKPQQANSQDNITGGQEDGYDYTSTEMKNQIDLGLNLDSANVQDMDSPRLRPPKNALMSGASSARASDERSRSAASRQLSVSESANKDPMSKFFRKS